MQRYDHGGNIYIHPQPLLDFSSNINPLGYPAGVKEAIIAGLDGFRRYPDASCRELTNAIAIHHDIDPKYIQCGNGAADIIYRICACFQAKKALITAPAFSEYERAVLAYGGQVVQHPLKEGNNFDVDDGFLDAITEEVQMVFLCTPNNPTGRLISFAFLLEVAKRCQKVGAYLVLDECFIDFTSGQSMVDVMKDYPRLLILRAFTKMYSMAGYRLGYLLCSNEAMLEKINAFGATWSVSGPAQAAGLAALKDAGWVSRTRTFIREEREFLQKSLNDLELSVIPGEANYLLFKHSKPLYKPLLDQGILVRDCGNYTGLSSLFIRVGIQTRENNLKLITALQEVLHG